MIGTVSRAPLSTTNQEFGFIEYTERKFKSSIYFHNRNVDLDSRPLKFGDKVSFDIVATEAGLAAQDVRKVKSTDV